MKLRLPNKLQAALVAALASVSFTTLSSGTIAVATGAALLAGQQAQATINTETVEGGTKVSTATWNHTYASTVTTTGVPTEKHDATLILDGRMQVNGTAGGNNLSNYGGDIVVGNGGSLYLNTWQQSAITLTNDIYIGETTYGEASTWGVLRFGNDSHATTLNGNIYLIEDSSIGAHPSSSQAVYINGTVTDLIGETRGNHTLTMKRGVQYHFNSIDLTGLTLDSSVVMDASGTVKVGELNGSGTLSVTASDLTIATAESQSATFSGTLKLGGGLVKTGEGAQTISGSLSGIKGAIDVQAGTLNLTPASSGISTHAVNVASGATLNITTTGENAINVAGTINNSGALTLSGKVSLAGALGSGGDYAVYEQGTDEYSDGTDGYLTTSTKYYLVKGQTGSTLNASGVTFADTGITKVDTEDTASLVFQSSNRGTVYYINTEKAYDSSSMGSAASIMVTSAGTLSVGGSDAESLLNKKITGNGTVVINENTSLPTGTASNPYTTLATGTLRIAASKTLTLGTNKDSHYYDLSSFSAVELENGALIRLKQRPGVVLNNVSVASGTAHIGKNDTDDTYNANIDAATLRGTTLVNGELQMGTNWKWQMSIDKLTGSGTVVARRQNETARLIINDAEDFTGTLQFTSNGAGSNSSEIVVKGSASFILNSNGSNNTLTLQGGEGVTVQVAAEGENTLANTITMNGGGALRLMVKKGGQNVNLKTITADTLKLAAGDGHNSRFVYNGSSNLSGVKNLYFDGAQLWLNSVNTALNYSGTVTFGTENHYSESAQLDSAFRVNSSASFSGAVDVQKDAKITWQTTDKYVEFAGDVTGSGNLTLATYSGNQYNGSKFIISGDASEYAGALKVNHASITLEIKEGAQLTLAGGSSLTGNVTLDGALKMNSAANTTSTISGTVSGAGSLTADGAGTLTLTHANTYSGGTTVNGGTVNVNAQNALGTGDVTVNGGTLNLGGYSHTLSTLTVNGGTVTTTNNGGDGCITGDIYINAGGTFQVNGGHDAFGYNDGQTDNIVMQGSADHYATLQLNQNNTTNSVTMQTNLVMEGYAAITSKANTKGFNTHGGSITATGTHNTIDLVDIRKNVTIDVTNTGDELTIGKMTKNSDGDKVLTKTGAGTLNFTGPAEANALNVNAGAVNFAGTAAISGAVALGENAALSTAGATIGGAVSLATGSSWTNTGATTVAGATTLSGTAALTNSGTLTLNGNFAMAAGSSVTNSGTVNFGAHTLTIAQDRFEITSTGSVAFNAGTVFDLSLLTEGENHTFTLFTGAGAGVNLSGYNFTVANITGFEGASQYGWTFNANGTITYSETMSFEWAGTASEWVDGGDGWTKNGNPAQYASSVDADAVFVASEESGFVKDISVNTAVQAHNVTVQDAYTFTLANSGSVTATALALEGDAASLSINGTGTVSATAITAAGKDITVGSGIVLQGGTADAFNLHGTGTYALGSGATALGSVVLDDAWTGTLKFSHVASYADINLNAEAFNNTSAIEFDDVTGNWCSGNNHYTRQLILSGQGLTVTNGYSTANYYFDGGVSGAGDMKFTRTDAVTQNLNFTKDISGWTGSLQVLNGFTVNANFYGEAATVNAGISRTGGTLNVLVGNGSAASTTTFTKAVGASSLTVKSLANATFNEAVTLAGDLNLNANATATFNKAVSAASLEAGASKSTGADVTFNGDLTLSGSLTLDGTDAKAATVTLNGDTTVNGSFDLSHGQTAHGSVTLASNKTLDLKGNIWMSQTASLILQQDATAKFGGDLTVKGLENGATIARPGNTDQYNLNNSSYTLTKVEATVNTAQDNVQLLFTDSKFVTGQNVTLKNAGSSFTAMDIQGGTTTVGASDLTADTTVNLGAVTLSGGTLTLANHVIGAVDSLAVAEGTTNTISGYKLDMGTAGAVALGGGSSLTLDGVTVDLTHMASEGEDVQTLVGGSDGAGKNGFVNLESKVRLFSYGADASVALTNDPTFLRGVNTGSLTTEGDNKGLVTFNGTSYSAFYVNAPEITEHLASIVVAASTHGGLQAVYLNGGTLDADTDDKIAELHLMEGDGAQGSVALTGPAANFGAVTGAGILNVDGATTLNADSLLIGAGKTVTFAGSENINITSITNRGTLDIGAGAKVTTTATAMGGNGTSFVTTGEGTFVGNAFSLVGGTVSFGSDAQISGGDVLARSGELIIGGHTVIDGTLQGGDGSGKTARISVLEGGVLDVDTFNASWGWSSFTVDGVLNVADTMRLSTGGENYVIGGKGLVNTEKLTIQNVGKYFFDGTDGLTLQVGAGGITNGNNGSSLTLENDLRVLAGADMTVSKNATLVGDVIFDSNGNKMTISSILSGEGGLIKEGEGTLTLSGANTYTGDTVVKGGTLDIQGSISAGSKVKVDEDANIAGRTENITVGIEAGKTATFTNEGGYTPKDSHVTFVNPGIGVFVSNLGDTEAVYSLNNAQMAVLASRMVVDSTATQDVQVDNALAVHEIENSGPVSLKLTSVTGSALEDVMAYTGDIEIDNLDAATQRLRTLYIGSGVDVTFLQKLGESETAAKEATVTIAESVGYNPETGADDYYGGILYAGGGTLHANLVLSHMSIWDLDGGSMNLGSQLTLQDDIRLDADTIRVLDLMEIGETHWMVNAVDGTKITYDDADVWYDSKFVRDAYEGGASLEGDFIIVQNNDGTKWGLKKVSDTPEPTTGTLGLLALAALAARRRRR